MDKATLLAIDCAWYEGQDAFPKARFASNPHPPDDPRHASWAAGWITDDLMYLDEVMAAVQRLNCDWKLMRHDDGRSIYAEVSRNGCRGRAIHPDSRSVAFQTALRRLLFMLIKDINDGKLASVAEALIKIFDDKVEEPNTAAVPAQPKAAPTPPKPKTKGASKPKAKAKPKAAEPPELPAAMTASVPFMITKAMKARLREIGLTDDEINQLTPAQAHERLNGDPPAG